MFANNCTECDCPTDNSSCICNQCTQVSEIVPEPPEPVYAPVFSTSTSRHMLPSEEQMLKVEEIHRKGYLSKD